MSNLHKTLQALSTEFANLKLQRLKIINFKINIIEIKGTISQLTLRNGTFLIEVYLY